MTYPDMSNTTDTPERLIHNWGPFGDEGWAVFNGGADSRIERIDEIAAFDDDPDVWDFIAQRVLAGSSRHTDALREVFKDNPDERAEITRHWGASITRLVDEKLEAE